MAAFGTDRLDMVSFRLWLADIENKDSAVRQLEGRGKGAYRATAPLLAHSAGLAARDNIAVAVKASPWQKNQFETAFVKSLERVSGLLAVVRNSG